MAFPRSGRVDFEMLPINGTRRESRKRATKMNWEQVEGNWKQLARSVQERWGKLTGNDIQTLTGKKDDLVGKIQERYGIAKEDAERQADAWSYALRTAKNDKTQPVL
jgi:uncharacterized protein YjbJ (UPF0337 family)